MPLFFKNEELAKPIDQGSREQPMNMSFEYEKCSNDMPAPIQPQFNDTKEKNEGILAPTGIIFRNNVAHSELEVNAGIKQRGDLSNGFGMLPIMEGVGFPQPRNLSNPKTEMSYENANTKGLTASILYIAFPLNS